MVISGNSKSFIVWLVLALSTGCGVEDIQRPFLSEHANRLLSADGSKTWKLNSRTAAGESIASTCLADNTLTFVKAAAGDSLYLLGRTVGCTSSDPIDTLFKAKYMLDANTEEVFSQTVTLSEEKHGVVGSLSVEELTSAALRISYNMDGESREEEYSH